jgi:hypothetical protein
VQLQTVRSSFSYTQRTMDGTTRDRVVACGRLARSSRYGVARSMQPNARGDRIWILVGGPYDTSKEAVQAFDAFRATFDPWKGAPIPTDS